MADQTARSDLEPVTPALVGREREQAVLRDALAATFAGRGALVLIGGEAGVGKTTLAEAACREASEQGALVLVGRCYDLTETPPYGPWIDLFVRYQSPPAAPSLPLAFAQQGTLSAVASQADLCRQVHEFLTLLAIAQPVVLLLDDLHWADPASLDLLHFLTRYLDTVPLLVLATYRSDEVTRHHPLAPLLPTLMREAHATRLDLHPLTAANLAALVQARYTLTETNEARLVTYLHDHAEGNPFYSGELLRALEDSGRLHHTGEGWQLGDLGEIVVPPLLLQIIVGRVARLGAAARTLLALAATIGPLVPFDLWASVADTDEATLLDTIASATEAHLLVEAPAEDGYRFVHALLHEALYADILLPRRRAWHRRLGETLAAARHPDPDAVAYHFQHGHDPRAAVWLVRAGERAVRAYAWVTATARYEAALALLEAQEASPLDRARLLHTLALLHRYTDRPKAIVLLTEAVVLATDGGDAVLASAAHFDQGVLRCMDHDFAAGLPPLRATLPTLEALAPVQFTALPTTMVLGLRPEEAYHRGALFYYLVMSGHLTEAAETAGAALTLAPGTSYRTLMAVGLLRYVCGEPTLAVQALSMAHDVAQRTKQYREVTNTLFIRANVLALYHADNLAARTALVAEVAAALPAARAADPRLTATEVLAYLRLVEGAWEELAQWVEEHPGRLLSLEVMLALWRGDDAAAWAGVRALLPDGLTTRPGTRSCLSGLDAQQVAYTLALQAGDLPLMRAWLEAHDGWNAWSGAVLGLPEGHLGWAAYYRATGDLAQAEMAARQAHECASAPRQPLALLAAHRCLGEIATTQGHHAEAGRHLAAALALAEACAAPYEHALTLLALAELHADSGQHQQSRAALGEARALLSTLGARPALARAAALESRLAAAPFGLPGGLTTREAEVLRLVAAGLPDAQVAARLFVSRRTIHAHLRSIYDKLDVTSRSAATRFALEHGLA